MNTNDNMTVATTILSQLGGRRFIAMTGAKNLLADQNSLHMKLGSGCADGITHMRVVLDADDTYTVIFFKVRGVKVAEVSHHVGVYADSLGDVIYNATGFYTSL